MKTILNIMTFATLLAMLGCRTVPKPVAPQGDIVSCSYARGGMAFYPTLEISIDAKDSSKAVFTIYGRTDTVRTEAPVGILASIDSIARSTTVYDLQPQRRSFFQKLADKIAPAADGNEWSQYVLRYTGGTYELKDDDSSTYKVHRILTELWEAYEYEYGDDGDGSSSTATMPEGDIVAVEYYCNGMEYMPTLRLEADPANAKKAIFTVKGHDTQKVSVPRDYLDTIHRVIQIRRVYAYPEPRPQESDEMWLDEDEWRLEAEYTGGTMSIRGRGSMAHNSGASRISNMLRELWLADEK